MKTFGRCRCLAQATTHAAATAPLAMAFVLDEPLADAMRSLGWQGWASEPGLPTFLLLGALTLSTLIRRQDCVHAGVICALIGAATLLDEALPVLTDSEEILVMMAAWPILLAAQRVGRMVNTALGIKLGFCLVAAFVLSVFLFNALSPYEQMHFFGGGSIV